MKNTKKIPTLRFTEFSEEWEVKKLVSISDKIGDGLHSTPIYDENGTFYFVNGNNFSNYKIEYFENTKKVNETEFYKYKIDLTDRTILMSINGTIGNLAFYNSEKVILGKSACFLNLKESENKNFIFFTLQNSKILNHFQKELTGSTIKNLSLTTIKNTEIGYPSKEEQKKIADFLTQIDNRIEKLTKKKEFLEKYKKGVMQKIFNQEIRFKDDNGDNYSNWEEKKLGELCKITTGKLDANAMVENGEYRFYTCAKDYFKIDVYAFDTEALLISGNGANVGYIHYYKGKFNAYQRTYVLDQFKEKIIYIKYFLDKNLSTRIDTEKKEGNTPYIVMTTLSEMNIKIPSLEEQTKIANFLTEIDKKINLTEKQLNGTKQYKKGLLQQMFI